ncbi:hypothetical protein [Leisingera methylohalidivorans]|uniref:Uncharacterized protein n=1 Tax=Leisingera methylohalidivorans DSM 14336 TaxID=999552 RepID=V9W008_9RHOB|nr:hypothetical protein [Leisingera methylohalidivorans]AHD02965.1 hypothetical protein METH_06985 [Leisingera methylohalidivorans DSM 14336]
MLTIQITCACGQYSTVTDERAIARVQRAERLIFRCTYCGLAEQVEARLAWEAEINPLEAAFANGMKDPEQ